MSSQNVFSEAVREFWETRERQARQQGGSGAKDTGARRAVTGGRQMDGFLWTLVELLGRAGVNRGHVFMKQSLELPGYYRPTKQWDLVVVKDRQLIAAIELKSQVGPSFGNNFNNRTEEAMGSALDLWTAYREGAFLLSPQPWLGYLMLLEDSPKSQAPVGTSEPHFPVFPEFREASYAKRYELFCRKLVRERQYNSACFLMAKRQDKDLTANYSEPAADLGAEPFIAGLLSHARIDPV